ncbi:hypothetical protein V2J09_004988 [Rumex salicifolius]
MDPWHQIKEEFAEPISISFSRDAPAVFPTPQPREGLNEVGPPPFLNKTYEMVEDSGTIEIVSWNRGGQSFVIWDPIAFSRNLLPRYFKHSNFSSFVRQLNTYGFRKIDPDKWEFANEEFLRGQKHNLKNIRRRRTPPSNPLSIQQDPPCMDVGVFGVNGEVDRLKRDKQTLMAELVKLRQQQQSTRAYLQSMENRLQNAELKQQHMMNFLARSIQNPGFLQKLTEQSGRRRVLEEAITKKRRRKIGSCFSSSSRGRENDLQVSELEALALEMQGFGRSGKEIAEEEDDEDDEEEEEQCGDRDLDDEFWDELFSEDLDLD